MFLDIREVKIKTILKFHFTSIRVANIMKTNAINENEDIQFEELLFTVGGRINGTITKLIRNISTISKN